MQSTSKVLQHISPVTSNKIVSKQSYGCIPLSHFCEDVLSKETVIEDKVKRPMSSFLLWARIKRKNYSKKNPKMLNSEISKLLGYTWNKMSAIEKLPFTTQAKNLRTAYMTNHPKYSTKKCEHNKGNYSKMDSAQRNNDLDVSSFLVNKSLNNNDIVRNPSLKSYCYLQNAYIAQQTATITKYISSNDVIYYSSDIGFNNIQSIFPLKYDPCVIFNKNNKFNTESNIEVCKETTTLHYYPSPVQLHLNI
nr:sex-determining region Y protein-like [Hydra vulgaris]